MKYLVAGFLMSLLATIDQLFVIQRDSLLASITTLLLIFVSTHVVVDISTANKNKANVFFYALGAALGTFLAIKLF